MGKIIAVVSGKGGTGKGGAKGAGKKGGPLGQPNAFAGSGKYRVVLNVDGVESSRIVTIEADPRTPDIDRPFDEAEEDRALRRLLQGRGP